LKKGAFALILQTLSRLPSVPESRLLLLVLTGGADYLDSSEWVISVKITNVTLDSGDRDPELRGNLRCFRRSGQESRDPARGQNPLWRAPEIRCSSGIETGEWNIERTLTTGSAAGDVALFRSAGQKKPEEVGETPVDRQMRGVPNSFFLDNSFILITRRNHACPSGKVR
jgi:hypothetical protein